MAAHCTDHHCDLFPTALLLLDHEFGSLRNAARGCKTRATELMHLQKPEEFRSKMQVEVAARTSGTDSSSCTNQAEDFLFSGP